MSTFIKISLWNKLSSVGFFYTIITLKCGVAMTEWSKALDRELTSEVLGLILTMTMFFYFWYTLKNQLSRLNIRC